MDFIWLNKDELASWVRLVALLELLPAGIDSQLRKDADLTHFEYYVLVRLSEQAENKLRMAALADQTNASLPRLSHVVQRLESRGLIERFPSERDRRATNVRLTEAGRDKLVYSAPGHVTYVRKHVIDALSAEQVGQLKEIAEAILTRLDPDGAMTAMYQQFDEPDGPGAR